MEKKSDWHSKNKDELFVELKSTEEGLFQEEANKRIKEYGFNNLPEKKKKSLILLFFKQFNSWLIFILLVAMIISFLLNHIVDASVIFFVVCLNATIGFFQENKAEKAIEALKKMIVSYARVYRDGELKKIESKLLVPGDIIDLEEGDIVPADARIIELNNLLTKESSLTGESTSVRKNLEILFGKKQISDITNMVFSGTMVVSGTAKAIVVSTGINSEIGKIAKTIQDAPRTKSHFEEKTKELALFMGMFAIIGAVIIFSVGYFVNKLNFFDVFLFTIASLVSAIPEGLPAILVVVLSVGSWRMSKRNAIIRDLKAVETFGIVNVISTDKTGTLTSNTMNVQKIITNSNTFQVTGEGWQPLGKFYLNDQKDPINPLSNKELIELLTVSSLTAKGEIIRDSGKYDIIGDPTEVAMLSVAEKASIKKSSLLKENKILFELPFRSEHKLKAVLIGNQLNRKRQILSIGAFEEILDRSKKYFDGKKDVSLSDEKKTEFLNSATKLANEGLRVLAISKKDCTVRIEGLSEKDINGMSIVGFVGMRDPPRNNVKQAIKNANNAGIRVIMNTGDHKSTAVAIAKEIGLIKNKNESAISGEELEKLSEEEFYSTVQKINVFARVSPHMKLKIVMALQKQGNVVAMTGDGVNDAPSLKRANIGVAMGIIGTDVARESSEVVLADDNFASIIYAVEEGKIVFRNVKSTSTFLITSNVAEQITMILTIIFNLPLPLLPIHILWMNLVTDGLNGIPLALEKSHGTSLLSPPISKNQRIIDKEIVPFLVIISVLMAAVTVPLFFFYLDQGINKAMTVAFVSMSFFHIFNAFNMRSLHKNLNEIGFLSNKYLLTSTITSILLVILFIYSPFLNRIFQFVPLNFSEVFFIGLVSTSIVFVGEGYKLFRKRSFKKA